MKTLYFDCGMGAAGDMLTAALLELLPDGDAFLEELNALQIPGVHFQKEKSAKCGITGTHVTVTVNGEEEESHDHHHEHHHDHENHGHEGYECESDNPVHDKAPSNLDARENEHHHKYDYEHVHDKHDHKHDHDDHCHAEEQRVHEHSHDETHHHASMHDVEHIVRDHLQLPEKVREDVLAVYGLIAEAESHAHGVPVTEIHFHEVGTMDAIADVTAVCLLMNRIAPERVVVSPVHVGSGQVRCAHGILPVPAPATAYILKDVPIYGGAIRGELCTPTGAALLKHFATDFGSMPAMSVQSIGYGMGKKDFEAANCVRVMLGESIDAANTKSVTKDKDATSTNISNSFDEKVYELSCNVDDMTGEEAGFAIERLFEAGARDAYVIPIIMKKNRPGFLIRALCMQEDKKKLVETIFRHTTTIGIRECELSRYILDRKMEHVETPYGTIHRKVSEGYGVTRGKLEFEDLAKIAREKGLSLWEVRKLMEKE